MSNSRASPHTWLITLLKAALSVAAIAYILSHIDRSLLLADWNKLHSASIVAIVCLVGLQTSVIASLRLKLIYRVFGLQLPLSTAWLVAISGSFVEQVALGFIGGDATRLFVLHQKNVPMKHAFPVVILDRILGLSALALLAAPGLPNIMEALEGGDRERLTIFGGLALVLACAIVLLARRFSSITPRLGEFATMIANAVGNGLLHVRVLLVLFLALLTHGISVLVFFVIGHDLNLPLTNWQWFFIVPTALLLAAIPITAGGWGLREAILIAALAPFGVTAETAIIPSVMFGVSGFLAALPGGIALLTSRAALPTVGSTTGATSDSNDGIAREGFATARHDAADLLGDAAYD